MRYAIGAVVGAVIGLTYYKLVGCPTGGCPITSNPWGSLLYGAILGTMIAGALGGR
jgi:hypothetical protein